MKKAVMISKEQYDKVIGSYDKVIEELKGVKAQLSALQEQENVLNALECGEELQDIAALEKLFEHYITNLNYQPPGQGGAYPKVIWEALRWYDRHADEYKENINLESEMVKALHQYQKQWFANGFLYASAILKA